MGKNKLFSVFEYSGDGYMQINKINQNVLTYTRKNNTHNKTKEQTLLNHSKQTNFNYPVSYAKINFKSRPIQKLWEEYDWYINVNKTPAIFSFLKIKAEPEVLNNFLTNILNTVDRSRELLSSITYNPRQVISIVNTLETILPNDSKILMPFMYDSPYYQSYAKFIDWKVSSAHSVDELLRIRPDWNGDVLKKKNSNLHHNDAFSIGNIPKEIPKEHLKQIAEYLSQYMEFGVKTKKKINSLKINNRQYDFAYFTEGKSDKNVFGVFTPEGKKYVLKMNRPEVRSLDKPFALGTLAKIDAYLTYNNCRNSAPLCYYNHNYNFSIYKYMEHIQINTDISNLNVISKKIPDFKALGLAYNDTVGTKNFFLLNPKADLKIAGTKEYKDGVIQGEWVSVDNDHVTYNNKLQPPVSKYHSALPNAMQMFF